MSKKCLSNLATNLAEFVFEYETQKVVTVRSFRIGLLYRFLQILIILYVIGYAIIYTKGYHETDTGQSTVITKIKGSASSLDRIDLPVDLQRIWDSADYVVPPMLRDSVMITTNVVITPKQHISFCPEDPNISPKAICNPDDVNDTCSVGTIVRNGNGPMTGRCVKADRLGSNYSCEIKAWCPVEDDSITLRMTKPVLDEVENFTILLKNVVAFPYFGVTRRNIDAVKNAEYGRSCTYHPETDPMCPIFKVGDIVKLAGGDITQISLEGGTVNVLVRWDCDLDFSINYCLPTFVFSYLKGRNDLSGFSPGLNFRYGNYYRLSENGSIYRDLIKAYGILFVFNVEAKAGKFSIVQLSLNVGAGLALLGLASVLMDWMLLNLSKDKNYYFQQKFITISEQDLQKIRQRNRMTKDETALSGLTETERDKTQETLNDEKPEEDKTDQANV